MASQGCLNPGILLHSCPAVCHVPHCPPPPGHENALLWTLKWEHVPAPLRGFDSRHMLCQSGGLGFSAESNLPNHPGAAEWRSFIQWDPSPCLSTCHGAMGNCRPSRHLKVQSQGFTCICWLKITLLISSFFCFWLIFFSGHDCFVLVFSCLREDVLFFLSCTLSLISMVTPTGFFLQFLWFREIQTSTESQDTVDCWI